MSEHAMPLFISADHPAYAGHFPGQPILPGVVLLDAALHAIAARQGLSGAAQLKSAKFHRPVQPGEPLTLHTTEPAAGSFRFDIRCRDLLGNEHSVASGSVVFSPATAA